MPLILALLSLLLFPSTSAWADDSTVQAACTNFPPYKIEKTSKNDIHRGIDLDVIEAAFALSETSVNFEFFPWKRTVYMAQNGQTDVLCGCAYRPEREADFIYSDMLGNHSQGIFITEESKLKTVTNFDDLKGMSIAAVRGYAVHEELKSRSDITVIEAKDDRQLIDLLLASRVDAIYSYRDIILYRLSFNAKTRKVRYFEFSSQPYYLCFARQKPNAKALVETFNKGLRTIRFNGTYTKIWSNYR